jgi:hypothetical protein
MFDEVRGHQKIFDQIQSIQTFDDTSWGPHRFLLLNSADGTYHYHHHVENPSYVVGHSQEQARLNPVFHLSWEREVGPPGKGEGMAA